MKRKGLRGSKSNRKGETGRKMKGTLARHMQVQLGQVSLIRHPLHQQSSSSFFQNILEPDASEPHLQSSSTVGGNGNLDGDASVDERDFILSQDLFCTPDYITPDNQHLQTALDYNKENMPCPKSPEKLNTVKSKKRRQDKSSSFDGIPVNPLSPFSDNQQVVELSKDSFGADEVMIDISTMSEAPKIQSYVSPAAVALRCRVMPPPCIKNPYLTGASAMDADPFSNQRSKCAGFFPAITGGDGLSRYHTDFHEIQQIGTGNFSRVFQVLKRIDGCLYAVKHSTRQLHQDVERRKALMEVQVLAALGSHENIVRYYSSWFENDQLFIQLELCDHSLSISGSFKSFTEGEVLEAMHQIAKALQFIHERGIAHLDVKPDNIYVKNDVYKLGDFGCATLLDMSLPIEEGDARYMPQEILNEKYDHLHKVDIFSLGVSIYELIRGSPLPEAGQQFLNLREGKLPLLPGHSLQLQNLLKVMVDPDPVRRPSAKELVVNSIFDKHSKTIIGL